jgi:hypothetical protein
MPVITTGIGRTARSHLGHPNRQTEVPRPYENHHIRSSIAATYSGGLIHEYAYAA